MNEDDTLKEYMDICNNTAAAVTTVCMDDGNADDHDQELSLNYDGLPYNETDSEDLPSENGILPVANYCEQRTDLQHLNMEKKNTVCAQYILTLIPQECNKNSNWENNE